MREADEMTKKRESQKKPDQKPIVSYCAPGEDENVALARTVLRPTVQAAVTLKYYDKTYGDLELNGLISALTEQTKASNDGDLGRAESMLTTQAHTLDAIFNNLATRAIKSEYISNLEAYLKLALRSQSQCRATWEALSAIQNPPMSYVHQANIAHGPQQVNNANPDDSGVRENQKLKNKLMEKKDGEWLDTRATGATSQADPAMATVGKIDRAEDGSR
jgi:hypothetical protein